MSDAHRPDRASFEEVALPHTRVLYAAARRLTGNAEDAGDLVQETFLRAYRTYSVTKHPQDALQDVLGGIAGEPAPAELVSRIRAALDQEDASAGSAKTSRPGGIPWWRRPVAALLPLAGAAVLIVVLLVTRAPLDLPGVAARDFLDLRAGTLELQMLTTDTATLEEFFAHRGILFETRVFDLAMMEFGLTGGRVHRLDEAPSALFVYAGPDGMRLLCQMFEGRLDELPDGAEIRENDGIRFQVYERGGITLAFWQEGSVLCVLASDGDAEQVVRLAFAKAVKV